MKKIFLLLGLMILLTGCITTPEKVSIDSTVEAAISTAIAPYESRYDQFITKDDLKNFQDEQYTQIKNLIIDQMELYKSEVFSVPVVTATPDNTQSSVYEYSGGTLVPTSTVQTYKNDATCVDRFTYVSDMTIPDGMIITPYTNFTKSWYITNSGDCTWNSNYKLVYNSGAEVGKSKSFSILEPQHFIQPGESVIVSADLVAPYNLNNTFTTYWALESDRGEIFGAGDAKNVFLSSSFTIADSFNVAQNFNSLTCSDDTGYITCGASSLSNGRGVVYYDDTPTLESGRSGNPAIVAAPPIGKDNSTVRFEFGPLRFPRGSWFYTNFCCRPQTPHCDVTVKLYTKEPGYDWILREEMREWNDGFMNEWKFTIDDIGIFDQDYFYAIEVTSNGGATEEDTIMFSNFRIY